MGSYSIQPPPGRSISPQASADALVQAVEQLEGVHGLLADESAAGAAGTATPFFQHGSHVNAKRGALTAQLGSTMNTTTVGRAALTLALVLGASGIARADRINNPTAVFSGLDKITGRIISFEVAINETVQFGALQMTPRICYTRPPTESPNTTSFVEVDEVTLENSYRRIFTGWMFASSPGLHGVEHPVYDMWLVDCKGGTEVIAEAKEGADQPPAQPQPGQRRQAERQPQAAPGTAAPPGNAAPPVGRVDVAPPRGVPVQPAQ